MLLRTVHSLFIATILATSCQASTLLGKVSQLEKISWELRNLESSKPSPENISRAMQLSSDWEAKSREFALWLDASNEVLQFSDEYLKMDPMARNNMQHVVNSIRMIQWQKKMDGEEYLEPFAKYFPGWGYAQPKKVYKLGRETKREFLHAFWEKEERVEKIVEHKEIMVDIKILAKLKAAFPNLIVGAKVEVEIGGEVHFVYKVSFHKEVTIKTTQQIKKGVERVWFELFEADKPWPWQDPEWEKVGETYQHHTNPTGEQVIVDVDVSAIQA